MVQEHRIHQIFKISVLLKAIGSILEIVGGALLFFTGILASVVNFLVTNELVEDPHDFIANDVQQVLPFFSAHSQLFAATYLLSHGIVKIFVVIGLLRNKLWAYPAGIIVFIAFIIYQIYRYTHTHSIFLILLTLFDIFLIFLTWHEYKYLKKYHRFP